MLRWSFVLVALVPGTAYAGDACVSRYWRQLDQFCDAARKMPQPQVDAPATTDEAGNQVAQAVAEPASALQKALAACQPAAAEAQASQSLAEREQALQQLAAPLHVELGAEAEKLEIAAVDYLELLSQRVAADSMLQTGAGADVLVNEALTQVCAEAGIKSWLPESCRPHGTQPALLELRRRLLMDLVTLPRRQAERDGRLDGASQQVRASLALLSASLSPDAVRRLVLELLPDAACNSTALSPAPVSDPLARAAQLLQRLVADGARFGRSDAYYLSVAQNELQRLSPGVPVSSGRQQALRSLLRALRALERAAAPTSAAALEARLGDVVLLFQSALEAVSVDATPPTLPQLGLELSQAVLRGDLEAVTRSALSLARQTSGAAISVRQARMIETAVRFALAHDEDEAKRILRGLIVPLPRWSENVLFDLNGDIPNLKSGAFKVVGDALLGYNGKRWGIAARGAVSDYDYSTDSVLAETFAGEGGAEAWLSLPLGTASRAQLELRLFGKGAVYDTSHTSVNGAAIPSYADETSVMGRGGLLASLRYQPGERLAAGLWLGAGGQFESYDSLNAANGSVGDSSNDSVGLLLQARARVELAVVPRWLVSRLRVDAQRYSLTRDALDTTFGNSMVAVVANTLSAQQTELKTRLFLDAEVARFLGFVPSVNAGFDGAFFSSNTESHSSFVPVFGAGLRRVAF